MTGPREYSTGTRANLFALARGTCYFPDCDQPVIRAVEGHQTVNVQIAHICGAKPGSPRHDESTTDEQRASFDNLILLCKPHHDLIDKLESEQWSADDLRRMKTEREGTTAAEALRGLRVTPDALEDMLREVLTGRVLRAVSVDLACGFETFQGLAIMPIEAARSVIMHNPSLRASAPHLVVTIWNTGALDAFVDAITLYVRPQGDRGDVPAFTLAGRNDLHAINGLLPKQLRVGESMHWLFRASTVQLMVNAGTVEQIAFSVAWVEVHLGSGEHVASGDLSTVRCWNSERRRVSEESLGVPRRYGGPGPRVGGCASRRRLDAEAETAGGSEPSSRRSRLGSRGELRPRSDGGHRH
jgi:hypothetical protein